MLHLFYLKQNEILDSFIYLSIMFVTKHILVTNKYSFFFFSRFLRRNIQQKSQDVDRNKYQLGCPGNCGHASWGDLTSTRTENGIINDPRNYCRYRGLLFAYVWCVLWYVLLFIYKASIEETLYVLYTRVLVQMFRW